MTVFREESGAVGLSGRDLPAAQALAGHASVVARAGQYEASGAFPGQATSSLQALAYLHLLNGVTAGDAIAFARAAAAEPPDGRAGRGPTAGTMRTRQRGLARRGRQPRRRSRRQRERRRRSREDGLTATMSDGGDDDPGDGEDPGGGEAAG